MLWRRHVSVAFLGFCLLYMKVFATTSVSIKQRKTRVIKEPIPIRGPSSFQGGVMADRVTRDTPVNRWFSLHNDPGDISMYYFQNITHKSEAKKVLLGIWKGYEGNYDKNVYRSLIFDDGDICRTHPDRRYSFIVELNKKDYSGMHEYMDTIETSDDDPCQFKAKINFYAKDDDMKLPPAQGDIVDGIVQWFEDPESPHIICKDIKCDYKAIEERIDNVLSKINELDHEIKSLMSPYASEFGQSNVLQAAVSIVTAANDVLTHSKHVYNQLTEFESKLPSNCVSAAQPPQSAVEEDSNTDEPKVEL